MLARVSRSGAPFSKGVSRPSSSLALCPSRRLRLAAIVLGRNGHPALAVTRCARSYSDERDHGLKAWERRLQHRPPLLRVSTDSSTTPDRSSASEVRPGQREQHPEPANPFLKPASPKSLPPADAPRAVTLASIADAAVSTSAPHPTATPGKKTHTPAYMRTITVSNLPINVRNAHLRELFAPFGLIRNIQSSGGASLCADIEFQHLPGVAAVLRAAAEQPFSLHGVQLVVHRPVQEARFRKFPLALRRAQNAKRPMNRGIIVLVIWGLGPLADAHHVNIRFFREHGHPLGTFERLDQGYIEVAYSGTDEDAEKTVARYAHDPLVVCGRIVSISKGVDWGQIWIRDPKADGESKKVDEVSEANDEEPKAIEGDAKLDVPEAQAKPARGKPMRRDGRRRWHGRDREHEFEMSEMQIEAEKTRQQWLAQLDEKLHEGKSWGMQKSVKTGSETREDPKADY